MPPPSPNDISSVQRIDHRRQPSSSATVSKEHPYRYLDTSFSLLVFLPIQVPRPEPKIVASSSPQQRQLSYRRLHVSPEPPVMPPSPPLSPVAAAAGLDG